MRQRPIPLGSRISTATAVRTFLPFARPPDSPFFLATDERLIQHEGMNKTFTMPRQPS